ncbi:MAG: MSMEG_0570 family nitrogen starvation response protein [Rhizobacter sp.]|nr:MSMEG_0570 family nitrogen starvation response protein [Rhizobacter sp.]MBP6270366.1 MSMEG_0570 family nitrogen starvation response protein [Rhizobacter sp.]
MPAMHFQLRWPDGSQARCYSPSLVIKDYFQPDTAYPLPLFMTQVREALHIASERVRAKFGFACSQALDQLAQIEHTAARFAAQPDAQVEVLAFYE